MNTKSGMLVDEIWSYALANSYDEAFYYPGGAVNDVNDVQYNKWMEGRRFFEYQTVQPGEEFSYDKVWRNQAEDVHPPLFYALLHTVCSFFPDTINKWQGFSLNIVFFILTQITLYFLVINTGGTAAAALWTCAFYGFTMASTDTFVYIRMYAMLVCLCLTSALLHLKLFDKGVSAKRMLPVMAVTVIGGLTHYHFWIYAFFQSLVFVCIGFIRRQQRSMILYGTLMFLSIALAWCCFPPMFSQMLGTNRGMEAVEGIAIPLQDLDFCISNVIQYLTGIPRDYLSLPSIIIKILFYLALLALFGLFTLHFLGGLIFFYNRRKESFRNTLSLFAAKVREIWLAISGDFQNIDWEMFARRFLLFIPPLMFVCLITPMIVGQRSRHLARYFFAAIPFFCAYLGLSLYLPSEHEAGNKKHLLPAIILILCAIGSHIGYDGEYLFNWHKNLHEYHQLTRGANCIFIPYRDCDIHGQSDAFINSKRVFPTRFRCHKEIAEAAMSMPSSDKNLLIIADFFYPEPIIIPLEKETGKRVKLVMHVVTSLRGFKVYEIGDSVQ